jgi:DNA mismatch endonuclease (patch repair protein)
LADVVDPATRSRMMSGIRSKNTKPEMMIRRGLHARGFRYRLHCKLPGKPDICLPKYRAVVFVHGCFWHAHDCGLFKVPASRPDFWRQKLLGNADRDMANISALESTGWRIATVWECSLRGRGEQGLNDAVDLLSNWLRGKTVMIDIRG